MKLKTSQVYAVEGATQVENSTDLRLLGSEYLSGVDQEYAVNIKLGNISSTQNSFFSVYGLDCKFFYIAQLYKSAKLQRYEVGIGYLEQHDGNFVLKRSQPLYFGDQGQSASTVTGPARPFYHGPDEHVVVSTHIPRSYLELLTDDNCVITSIAPHIPSIAHISKNSILGRLDNNIEDISINKLFDTPSFSSAAVEALSKNTKQLLLKSSKLIAKNINVDYLSLKPSKDRPPEKDGTIYFDNESNSLCYYASGCWRELVWKRCLDENTP